MTGPPRRSRATPLGPSRPSGRCTPVSWPTWAVGWEEAARAAGGADDAGVHLPCAGHRLRRLVPRRAGGGAAVLLDSRQGRGGPARPVLGLIRSTGAGFEAHRERGGLPGHGPAGAEAGRQGRRGGHRGAQSGPRLYEHFPHHGPLRADALGRRLAPRALADLTDRRDLGPPVRHHTAMSGIGRGRSRRRSPGRTGRIGLPGRDGRCPRRCGSAIRRRSTSSSTAPGRRRRS